jgi:hypothetical protein
VLSLALAATLTLAPVAPAVSGSPTSFEPPPVMERPPVVSAVVPLLDARDTFTPLDDLDLVPGVYANEAERLDLPEPIPAPRIVVDKSKRELRLFSADSLVRTYRVALGLDPVRPKVKRGDDATPEGTYYICAKNPQSKYDKALALSYPGPSDAMRGRAKGMITDREYRQILDAWAAKATPPFDTALGGDVCIHGAGSSWDWTQGCIALNLQDIEELYRVIPLGASVEIRP